MASPKDGCINHLVFLTLAFRSHLRPQLAFALHLLAVHPSLIITNLYTSNGAALLEEELELHPPAYLARIGFKERWRTLVVDVGEGPIRYPQIEDVVFCEALKKAKFLERLWLGAGKAEGAGDKWGRRPFLILASSFRGGIRPIVRSFSTEHSLPITPVWKFYPEFALANPMWLLPDPQPGSVDNAWGRYQEYREQGLDEREAVIQALRFAKGELLDRPSLPLMYDYELWPQTGSIVMGEAVPDSLSRYHRYFIDADGGIDLGVAELDEPARRWCAQLTGCEWLGAGPQLGVAETEEQEIAVPEQMGRTGDKQVIDFLDDSLAQYGPQSLIYISFGTNSWPVLRPAVFESIIDALLTLDPPAPFVFSSAAAGPKGGQVSQEYIDKVHQSGRGIVVEWVPQVRLLKHPVTNSFLTHGGFGSTTESIGAGVPLIFCPFSVDQPLNAAHFSYINPIGISLIQLASGCDGEPRANGPFVHSTRQSMQQEVTAAIQTMRGPEGQRYRDKVREVREMFRKSAESGGASRTARWLERYFTER